MKTIICILSCLMLTTLGCNQNQTTVSYLPHKSSTESDLRALLKENGYTLMGGKLMDSNYELVSDDWVIKALTPSFNQYLYDEGISKYVSEVNDCDDFAIHCWASAHMLHKKDTSHKSFTSVAFGVVVYRIDGLGDQHAINMFVDSEGSLKFYDPQLGAIVSLSENEKYSISFWFM